MNRQFYAVRETTRNIEEGDFTLRLAMAKKVLDDNTAILVAHGYEGGGCWSDYYAVYKLDKYGESVEETIESFVGFPDEDTEYLHYYDQLNEYINKFCDFDEECAPFLKKECRKDGEFDEETGEFDHEWDWDDQVHFTASDEWQILYSWKKD
jgi:hypothetical protein